MFNKSRKVLWQHLQRKNHRIVMAACWTSAPAASTLNHMTIFIRAASPRFLGAPDTATASVTCVSTPTSASAALSTSDPLTKPSVTTAASTNSPSSKPSSTCNEASDPGTAWLQNILTCNALVGLFGTWHKAYRNLYKGMGEFHMLVITICAKLSISASLKGYSPRARSFSLNSSSFHLREGSVSP